MPNQLEDALHHAMSGNELSRVRTELYGLRILRACSPLLIRKLAPLVESHVWDWPQGDTETIAGVTAFPLANQRALRNQVR